jgi:long-chain acyl-CoA synthetase
MSDSATSERPFAWEKTYPKGLEWDVPLTIGTIPQMFDAAVAAHSGRPAIEFRGRHFAYGELGETAARGAAGLIALGADKHRPVALYLPNVPLHPLAFFAIVKTGAPVVHLSPLDAERELAHKLQDSGARALITVNFAGLLPNALKMLERGIIDHLIVGEDADWGASPIPVLPVPERPGVVTWQNFLEGAPASASLPAITPDDIALLQYTGGTTGMPRAAILTHANLTAAVDIYDRWFSVQRPKVGHETVIGVLPFFHIYALTTVLLLHIRRGDFILLRVKFDPEQTLHDIEVGRADSFPGVPTMWIALAARPDIARRDFSSLRYLGSGGAPLPVEVEGRFRQITGHRIGGGWGMTETSPAGTNIPAHCEPPAGTIGLPLPNIEMQVVALDDPRRVLPPGEIGEIRVRGPNVTGGYWKRPEESRTAFVDGYLLTGDIGRMDENGFFFIVDRKKDMIISGGFNVYPQMVEQAIYEHPSVEEVLVIGVPDDYRGEAAKAFIKLRPGASRFTLEELCAFLSDKIGRHERPAHIEFRDALPRTAVGKLSKVELKSQERDKRGVNTIAGEKADA